jgi:uncharacterized protein YyaL (SSP411 family)
MTDGATGAERPRYTNRLIREKSPYLLMHAHNPVEWYPWGEEALERARRESKPIFLSVGYSTCHWCHVMERESFENQEIAQLLSRHFISIKVDREERPDLDRLYMTFVQASTGSGGWPMSVFLTPDLKPFFGGTYWPPEDRYGRPGFSRILESVAATWENERARVVQHAAEVTEYLAQAAAATAQAGERPGAKALDAVYRQIRSSYDAAQGGFGGAPKFPRPVVLNFLLRTYARTGEPEALGMALHTLARMAAGGVYDHLGGGFHRYSVDAGWHVPHFEKMLYDQAQLAASYAEAFQITQDPLFAGVARGVLDYVLRDLRSPEGGFYAAEDADSLIAEGKPERGEGAFYVWTAEEIERVLEAGGEDDSRLQTAGGGEPPSPPGDRSSLLQAAEVFNDCYDVRPEGNVPPENDPQDEFRGKNILRAAHSPSEAARHFGQPENEKKLAQARARLLEARNRRPRPALDDKILTSWNGLMLSALARAAQALDEPKYLAAAEVAAEFIRAKLYDEPTGTLRRRYRQGEAAIDGFLEDYAFLIQGLLDLYEASFRTAHLAWAARLEEKQDELFWDTAGGGYFATASSSPGILVRMRDSYDGAEPSGNSVAALNLLRLARLTGREEWRARAEKIFDAFSRQFEQAPETLPQMAVALDFALSKPREIIIAGDRKSPDTQGLLRQVGSRFIPNKILLAVDGAEERRELAQWLPFIENVTPLNGKATAYVCQNYVCNLPTSDPEELARLLEAKP